MEEKREYREAPRIAHGFLVRYRSAAAASSGWLVSPLRDLSGTGARFLSERRCATGDPIELELMLPTSQQPVAISGMVAWAKPAQYGTMELGVTFELKDTATQRLIDAAVEVFLKK